MAGLQNVKITQLHKTGFHTDANHKTQITVLLLLRRRHVDIVIIIIITINHYKLTKDWKVETRRQSYQSRATWLQVFPNWQTEKKKSICSQTDSTNIIMLLTSAPQAQHSAGLLVFISLHQYQQQVFPVIPAFIIKTSLCFHYEIFTFWFSDFLSFAFSSLCLSLVFFFHPTEACFCHWKTNNLPSMTQNIRLISQKMRKNNLKFKFGLS